MEHTIKIVICTERGILEKYSVLLCRSLRQFGGEMSQTEIYSIAPRQAYYPSQKTISELEKLGATHLNSNLNSAFKDDYFVNKFIAAGYIEKKYPESIIVFLDSDQLFFNPPTAFQLAENTDVMIRAVDRKNIGVSSEIDTEWNYWNALYKLLEIDITKLHKVETSTGELILPYFQGGMIVSKAKNNLFAHIEKNYALVRQQQLAPKDGNFFVEQSTYSATILQQQLRFELVPNTYNYPFSLHNEIAPKFTVSNFENLHTAHYHDLLVAKKKPHYFSEFLENTEKGQWVKEQIIDLNIKPDTLWQKYLKKARKKLRKNFF
ncbi:MAG: hypothetical protein ACLGGV_00745 [Bacteroidia bacterium]